VCDLLKNKKERKGTDVEVADWCWVLLRLQKDLEAGDGHIHVLLLDLQL